MEPPKPPPLQRCPGCANHCLRVEPRYTACKKRRLCDRVDVGLLLCLPDFRSVEGYEEAHAQLLKGMAALDRRRTEPLPTTEIEFVDYVRGAHYTIFEHVEGFPRPGEFRGPWEDVTYGGGGRNQREGFAHDKIETGIRAAFRLATAHGEGWDYILRSAAFLAHFFRVHPFIDGNGRVGRFIVDKIARDAGKSIPVWVQSGEDRSEYIKALEYAHSHQRTPRESVRKLEKWLETKVVDAPPPSSDDLDGF